MAGVRVAQRRHADEQQLRRRPTPTAEGGGDGEQGPRRRRSPPAMVTTEVGYYAYNSHAAALRAGLHRHQAGQRELVGGARRPSTRRSRRSSPGCSGINSMPADGDGDGGPSPARHRPRPRLLRLDAYSSEPAYPSSGDITGSLNPDPAFPKFGHWSAMAERHAADDGLRRRRRRGRTRPNNLTDGHGQRPGDRQRLPVRATPRGSLINAFHRADVALRRRLTWACPAPADWDIQSDTTATYVGAPARAATLAARQQVVHHGSYATTVRSSCTDNNPAYSRTTTPRAPSTGPGGGPVRPRSTRRPR